MILDLINSNNPDSGWYSQMTSNLLKDLFTFKLKCPDNLLTPMSSKMFMYFFLQ